MIKFCTHCGADVSFEIPAGDALPRHVCKRCGHIHYENPKIICGALLVWQDKVLLCRRAIEPRKGWWTLPAGFMENNETLHQAAARETLEEANARVEIGDLYTVYSLPHISQVYFLFRARLLDLDFSPGIESLEVKLLSEQDIPWDDIAFRVIHDPLRRYFEERKAGKLGFHMGVIDQPRSD